MLKPPPKGGNLSYFSNDAFFTKTKWIDPDVWILLDPSWRYWVARRTVTLVQGRSTAGA
jgi:hypothetical protein